MGALPGSGCRPDQHNAPCLFLLATLLALGFWFVGCAKAQPAEWNAALEIRAALFESALRQSTVALPPSGEVRVQLAFGGAADLDLYVTDPLQETVYLGNSPSRSGGRLEQDLRCDARVPRIEAVAFPNALPGIYRVGVDYPEGCSARPGPVAFVVRVDHGGVHELVRQLIEPLHFEPIVLEFEFGAPE